MTTETQVADAPPEIAEAPAEASGDRLAALEQAVSDLAEQVDEMAGMSITSTELSVVPGLKRRERPIPIIVEETGEDATARWIEAGLYGVGCHGGEAIESLREEIRTVWHDLEQAPDSELSPPVQTMREVLRCYVTSAS